MSGSSCEQVCAEGPRGPRGATGPTGISPTGPTGSTGAQGPTGPTAVPMYANFYDDANTSVLDDAPIPFDTPGSTSGDIVNVGGIITLPAVGTYEVNVSVSFTQSVSVPELDQILARLDNVPLAQSLFFSTIDAVTGRTTTGGSFLIDVVDPAGSALEIRNISEGTRNLIGHIVITKIA